LPLPRSETGGEPLSAWLTLLGPSQLAALWSAIRGLVTKPRPAAVRRAQLELFGGDL
jgi:hypothetical protein